ncbi:hypothetical protein, partial [Streptomyces purpurascens]
MAVDAEAGASDYGKIRILKLPTNTTVNGPKQVQSQFNSQGHRRVHQAPERRRLRGRVRQPADGAPRRRTAVRGAGLRTRWWTEVPAAAQGAGH